MLYFNSHKSSERQPHTIGSGMEAGPMIVGVAQRDISRRKSCILIRCLQPTIRWCIMVTEKNILDLIAVIKQS